MVAELFDVDEVLVADSIRNTAQKGATYSGSFQSTEVALLVYSNPSPAINTPSGGYIFSWSEFDELRDASSAGAASVRQMRMEKLRSDRFEAFQHYDMNVVASACGSLFNDVLA